jgi:hypothetical protein
MEVKSAQPNMAGGPSQITVSLPTKRPAQYVLGIFNYLQRESEHMINAGNTLGQNVRAVGQRDPAKTHVMTATE